MYLSVSTINKNRLIRSPISNSNSTIRSNSQSDLLLWMYNIKILKEDIKDLQIR